MRLKTLRIILVVCFFILGLDLIYIQFLKGNYFYNCAFNITVPSARFIIFFTVTFNASVSHMSCMFKIESFMLKI